MFQLPLVLENLILLVEAGLGVLPALEQIVFSRIKNAKEQGGSIDLTTFLLKVVYDLSAHGMPFAEALERVADATEIRSLRHVLLHLDISASEGGELIPSMRSLSDHAHTEWRLSVETRVNRLENMVVFPVFVSVIGLMILTASVPLVPVLEFFETVKAQSASQGTSLGNPQKTNASGNAPKTFMSSRER
jgi:pilus assembly protein TadC